MKLSSAFRLRSAIGATSVVLLCSVPAITQNNQPSSATDATVAKPLSAKEQKRKQKQLEKELMGPWRKWLNEDVLYIITDEEKQA